MPAPIDAEAASLVRRISRLFRIERAGLLDKRPAPIMQRLAERRGELIDRLLQGPRSAALQPALAELAAEIGRSQPVIEDRLRHLEAELRLRRGGAPASGLRGGTAGQLLGSG